MFKNLHKCLYFFIYGYTYLKHYFDKFINWINPVVCSKPTFKLVKQNDV